MIMTSQFFKSALYGLFDFVIFYKIGLVLYLHIILCVSVLMWYMVPNLPKSLGGNGFECYMNPSVSLFTPVAD